MMSRFKGIFVFCAMALLVFCGACRDDLPQLQADGNIAAGPDDRAIVEELTRTIEHELETLAIPGLAIALVRDQEIAWAQGFGWADLERSRRFTADTVIRAGSVSKLFTDIAVMQLVESGEIDLDAPIRSHLPGFEPENPFSQPATIRQLMAHLSGLVREPPRGSYFDPDSPALREVVASLNGTRLVYPPGSRTKYSNAGVSVLGLLLEEIRKRPYEDVIDAALLAPLKMESSSFRRRDLLEKDLAQGEMWAWDGRRFAAPEFEFGIGPAANLYTTVIDLGRFASALMGGGSPLLSSESLQEMWRPQLGSGNGASGFGLGFVLSQLEGRRMVGHDGAVYGFSTQLSILPKEKLAVAAVSNLDVSGSAVRGLANHALRVMLAHREASESPRRPLTQPVPPEKAQSLQGFYRERDGEGFLRLEAASSQLRFRLGNRQGMLRAIDDALIRHDRLGFGLALGVDPDGALRLGDRVFEAAREPLPSPAPQEWSGLIGEYGWDHNTLFVLERNGQLHVLIEWLFEYPLTAESRNVFRFPDYGLYHGEKLIFRDAGSAAATHVEAAGVLFERRNGPAGDGGPFRIDPVRPLDELMREALAAQPPQQPQGLEEPDLVNLRSLDPSFRFDIAYAGSRNFMGMPFYRKAEALLQRPAAMALQRAHRRLAEKGLGLMIFDAYRPWFVTKMFWDATPADKKIFVADPSSGSRHNRGAAVDLTLYDLKTGLPVEMPSGFDEFTERAYADYPGGTSTQRWMRRVLRQAMEEQGFKVYPQEWWHFDFEGWERYPVLNKRFDELP